MNYQTRNVINLQFNADKQIVRIIELTKRFMRFFVHLFLASLVLLFGTASVFAESRYELDEHTLKVSADDITLSITAYSKDSFEVVYDVDGVKQLPSFSIAASPENIPLSVSETQQQIVLSSSTIDVVIDKAPLRVRFERNGQILLSEEKGLFIQDTMRGFRFNLDADEKLMGGGQRVLGMNRRGQRLPLDNRGAYNYSDNADVMYYGIPAVLSSKKYLLLFDNSARGHMDLGKSEQNIMQFEAKGGRTAYAFVAGESYSDVVKNFVSLTGKQSMPPRWALGNFASRFGYRNAEEARNVIAKFQADDIPLDAIIFDIFWFGPDIKGHMGNLQWDTKAFPEPDKMIEEFKQQGIKTVLITEPFILNTSKNWDEANRVNALATNFNAETKIFDFYFGTSGLVDVFDPKGKEWFWSKHKSLLDQGVEGIWGDLGEPEAHPSDTLHAGEWTADEIHNVYGHEWAKLVYENHLNTYPNKRPFIMMRSGFAGSQRYGMVPWSGDVSRTWSALQAQIEIALQMSVLGLAYSHSDLGGFVALDPEGDSETDLVDLDKELYIRWMQYGVFQPIYRPHSQEQIAPEPVFYDSDTKRIVRNAIHQRYKLLPYLYTMAYENSQSGKPLMQPLLFSQESNQGLFEYQDAYFWGDDMIVAPVTEAGAKHKNIYLPDGYWFELDSSSQYKGGQKHSVAVDIESIPVFVKAGAFIPQTNVVSTTDEYTSKALNLHFYAHPTIQSSTGKMYEDDGKTLNARSKNQSELLKFGYSTSNKASTFNLVRTVHGKYEGMPEQRLVTITAHNWTKKPSSITHSDGTILDDWKYDEESSTLTIKVSWKSDNQSVIVE